MQARAAKLHRRVRLVTHWCYSLAQTLQLTSERINGKLHICFFSNAIVFSLNRICSVLSLIGCEFRHTSVLGSGTLAATMINISSPLAHLRKNIASMKLRAHCSPVSVRLTSHSAPAGGLLGPTASDAYYSKNLILTEAAQLIQRRGYLWEAAEMDAAVAKETPDDYLSRVHSAASAFVNGGNLHDREEIVVTWHCCFAPS